MLIKVVARRAKSEQVERLLKKLNAIQQSEEARLIRMVEGVCREYAAHCRNNGLPAHMSRKTAADFVRAAAEWAWDEGDKMPDKLIELIDAYLWLRPFAFSQKEFRRCSILEYCTKASYPRLLGYVVRDWMEVVR